MITCNIEKKTYRTAIVINSRDHIKFIAKIEGGKIKESYAKLCEIHNLLNSKLPFAHDPKLGFLCSDLKNVGHGFGIEFTSPNAKNVVSKEVTPITPQVRIVKEKEIIKIKGRSIFGFNVQKLVEASYQVMPNLNK